MRKKVLALVLALVMVIAMLPTVAFAADYADTKGHWAEAQIDRWTDAGVVGGTGTGFNPNGNMTRAEAAQTFVSLLKLTKKADLTTYTDVPTAEWKVEALAKAVQKGIINGMSATTLVPDGQLTREQMFVMIGRALGIKPAETSTKTFVDGKETSSWATGYVNALVNMGVINGTGNNELNPTDNINRASVMTALDNLIGGYANTDGQTVEIVEGKITLIVADDVKVTGTADPEMPIVIAGEAKTVDLEGVTVTGDEAPVVQVQVEEVAIENAPEGTTVDVPAEATDVTVNGETAEPGTTTEVEATPAQTPTQSYTPPAPVEPESHTYTVTFDATYGEFTQPTIADGTPDTCYGGSNWQFGVNGDKEAKFAKVTVSGTGTLTLGENGMPAEPKCPDHEGYSFVGWYKSVTTAADINEENEFTEDTEITGNITVYAVWYTSSAKDQTCYGGENEAIGEEAWSKNFPTAPTEVEYTIVFDASQWGKIDLKDSNETLDSTCWGGNNTCWGGENGDSANNHQWVIFTVKTDNPEQTLKQLEISPNDFFTVTLKDNSEHTGYTFEGWGYLKNELTAVPTKLEETTKLSDMVRSGDNKVILVAGWKVQSGSGETCYGGVNDQQGLYNQAGATSTVPTTPEDAR